MRARRVLSLSFLLTTACIGVLAACGDDSTTVYIYLEAGTPDSGKREGGTTVLDDGGDGEESCDPTSPAAFTFTPPGRYLAKCDDALVSSLYETCIGTNNTIAGCDAAKAANPDCFGCLFGAATDPVAHPFTIYDPRVAAGVNQGLCLAAYKEETAPTECGIAYGQVETCVYAACTTSCFNAQLEDTFNACLVAARDTVCTTGLSTFASAKCQAAYDDSTYGFCTQFATDAGVKLTGAQYYVEVGKLVCGKNPNPDAGTITDAGLDANMDAGDAGDAGDPGDAGNDANL